MSLERNAARRLLLVCESSSTLRSEILPLLHLSNSSSEDIAPSAKSSAPPETAIATLSASTWSSSMSPLGSSYTPPSFNGDRAVLGDALPMHADASASQLGRMLQSLPPRAAGEMLDALSAHASALCLVLEADRRGAIGLPDSLRNLLLSLQTIPSLSTSTSA
jgi:hypothetical protein